MSRCGCERVSVQQLPVQVPPASALQKKQEAAFFCVSGHQLGHGGAGNAGKRLSKSESDLHISPYLTFGSSSHFVTGFVWLFIIPAEAEQIVSSDYFGFLQWRRCLHRDYGITPEEASRRVHVGASERVTDLFLLLLLLLTCPGFHNELIQM